MNSSRTITLRWIYGPPADIGYQLARFRFSKPVPTWQPAMNVYRSDGCVQICVELAGVDRSEVALTVEPTRLLIRGTREVPEPDKKRAGLQMLVMEIDYGPFERIIELREEIDVHKVRAEQQNGWLWIHLPLKT